MHVWFILLNTGKYITKYINRTEIQTPKKLNYTTDNILENYPGNKKG